jgi:D-sedoheptulose 7-phosphate isomerase
MRYPEQYRTELLNAIQGIDLDGVNEAIEIFREVRAHGNRIFVCGSGPRAAAAAHLLCDMVRRASLTRSSRSRILVLSDEQPDVSPGHDLAHDRVFVEQLKNIAEHGDVVVAISASGNAADVLRAFEFANRIGCRTISITGQDGGKLAGISTVAILVPASHPGSVEDAHMVVCHMIGYYFVNYDKG